MTGAILVADFVTGRATPSARDLVAAAVERGARFLAADVVDGEDETPEAHVDGHRIARLGRLAAEAFRRETGLFLRLHDTLSVADLAGALGVEKTAKSVDLRDRFLVVADGERTGKRLRRAAPQFPSALELSATPGRGLSRLITPNYQRSAADADDLVVPWGRIDAAKLTTRIAPMLAKRGARLWVSNVPEAEFDRATAIPAAGFVVRCALEGSKLGGEDVSRQRDGRAGPVP